MPVRLEQSERKLLIGAGVLLLVMVTVSVAVSPPQNAEGTGGASSYSASWNGTKAAYLLLQGLEYNVQRWENPPEELPEKDAEENSVLILADPTHPATFEDKRAIRTFLLRGGTVLATGEKASDFLPDAARFEQGEPFAPIESFHPVAISPLIRGVQEIQMRAPLDRGPSAKSALVVYGNNQRSAVVTIPVGKGTVIWWAESFPMTNGGLRSADNATLFLNSVGPPEGQTVYWDEYFHGVQSSLWSYFAKTPVPWGIAQLGILFVAILLTHSRRNGPIRVPQGISRLSPLEFVETLGDLYHEAHAGTTAVRILLERLRFGLIRTLGLPGNASSKDLALSASEALRWDRSDLNDVLQQGEKAKRGSPMDEKECLAVVKKLYWYCKKLEPGALPAGERPRG